MISRQPSLAKQTDTEGMTPLHYACQLGHFDVVKTHESLPEGKEVWNATNSNFDTPLHLSCRSSSIQIVCYLISKGANVDARNKIALTPLHVATQCGHFAIVEILLNEKAEVNCQAERGYTPLHYAAERRNSTNLINVLCNG